MDNRDHESNLQSEINNLQFRHTPVLLNEVVAGLAPRSGGRYVDGTLGGGGHAAAILDRSAPDGRLLGIDADPAALAAAGARLAGFAGRATLVHGNFRDLGWLAREHGFAQVDGLLLDLGVSSHQLDTPERGFSFAVDAPLDMRLDPTGGETTGELADLVARALGGRRGKIHPATRTFQALRIAVNRELESLEMALPQAVELLAPGGRLAVIAFHSLEDRIVKLFFRAESGYGGAGRGRLQIITKKPIEASEEENRTNSRSRSAKLRIAERVARSQESGVRSQNINEFI